MFDWLVFLVDLTSPTSSLAFALITNDRLILIIGCFEVSCVVITTLIGCIAFCNSKEVFCRFARFVNELSGSNFVGACCNWTSRVLFTSLGLATMAMWLYRTPPRVGSDDCPGSLAWVIFWIKLLAFAFICLRSLLGPDEASLERDCDPWMCSAASYFCCQVVAVCILFTSVTWLGRPVLPFSIVLAATLLILAGTVSVVGLKLKTPERVGQLGTSHAVLSLGAFHALASFICGVWFTLLVRQAVDPSNCVTSPAPLVFAYVAGMLLLLPVWLLAFGLVYAFFYCLWGNRQMLHRHSHDAVRCSMEKLIGGWQVHLQELEYESLLDNVIEINLVPRSSHTRMCEAT